MVDLTPYDSPIITLHFTALDPHNPRIVYTLPEYIYIVGLRGATLHYTLVPPGAVSRFSTYSFISYNFASYNLYVNNYLDQ